MNPICLGVGLHLSSGTVTRVTVGRVWALESRECVLPVNFENRNQPVYMNWPMESHYNWKMAQGDFELRTLPCRAGTWWLQ